MGDGSRRGEHAVNLTGNRPCMQPCLASAWNFYQTLIGVLVTEVGECLSIQVRVAGWGNS